MCSVSAYSSIVNSARASYLRRESSSGANTRVLRYCGNVLIIIRLCCFACQDGFSYVAKRAFLHCGRAFSGIVAGSRRNVYAVFIRSSSSFRFCFEKKRCQNILLPVCINIHFRIAAMIARDAFFSRHMACCLRRGGDEFATRESFIKSPILLF